MTVQPRPSDSERGSISLFTAVFATATILLLGLVVDGTARVWTLARADAAAAEAARAAADAADLRGTKPVIERAAAVRAGQNSLRHNGFDGTVTVTGPRTVTVTATLRKPYVVPIPGAPTHYTATRSATVTLHIGVTVEEH